MTSFPSQTHAPQKVLVIRLGAMGDLLHLSPSLKILHQYHPEIEIHVLTAPTYRELASHFDGVRQVWSFQKGRHFWETAQLLWQQCQQWREIGITHVVVLQPNLRSWLIAQLLLGFQTKGRVAYYRKEKLRVSGQTERTTPRKHAVEDFYQPFQHLFQLPSLSKTKLIPRISAESTPPPTDEDGLVIGIIPGVGQKRSNRAWPLENIQTLLENIADTTTKPVTFVFIGGPDDKPLAQHLINTLKSTRPQATLTNHCGQTSILETAALLKQCHLVLSGDTGPLHLAAAVGTSVISLYGPTSSQRTGPLGQQPITVVTPPTDSLAWPCEKPSCRDHSSDPLACMRGISVAAVLEAYKEAQKR